MSVYSTLDITRSTAERTLREHIMGDLTDEQLHTLMNAFLEPRLYNCIIVPDGHEPNDDITVER